MTALALGFIFVGSCDEDVTMAILQTMMEREATELKEKWARFMSLGLALLYLGKYVLAEERNLQLTIALHRQVVKMHRKLRSLLSALSNHLSESKLSFSSKFALTPVPVTSYKSKA